MLLHTLSGHSVNFESPGPEQICIEDVATGLSREYRFGNQGPLFTVAEHSVLCVSLAESELGVKDPLALLEVLLHDATEAYMHDLPTPLKRHLPDYMELEKRFFRDAIAPCFGLTLEHGDLVREVDQMTLKVELSMLLSDEVRVRYTSVSIPDPQVFRDMVPNSTLPSWSVDVARDQFLSCFYTIQRMGDPK